MSIQRQATTHAGDFTYPLLTRREIGKRGVILVGGSINTNLTRYEFLSMQEQRPSSTTVL